jgi:hypothetical protein
VAEGGGIEGVLGGEPESTESDTRRGGQTEGLVCTSGRQDLHRHGEHLALHHSLACCR